MTAETNVRQRVMKRTITIVTNGSEAFSATTLIEGEIFKIALEVSSLVSPHVAITDSDTGGNIWTEADVVSNKEVYPITAAYNAAGSSIAAQYNHHIVRLLAVAITAAGATKTGYLHIFYR